MNRRCLKYLIFSVCLLFGIFPTYLIFLHRFQSVNPRKIIIPRMMSKTQKDVISSKVKRDRLLCWICTGPPNHYTRARHVKATWGKRCDILLMMSSEEDKELGIIQLENVKEGRQWLWPKTVAAFKYIYKHHLDQVDWVLKADDDTFVIRYHLKDFYNRTKPMCHTSLEQSSSIQLQSHQTSILPAALARYVLSKAALVKFILEALTDENKCLSVGQLEVNRGEDIEMANCLINIGIPLEDTRDEQGRLRFLHYSPTFVLYPLSNLDFFHTQSGWEFKKGTEALNSERTKSFKAIFRYFLMEKVKDINDFNSVGLIPNMMYAMDWIFYHAKRSKTKIANGAKS